MFQKVLFIAAPLFAVSAFAAPKVAPSATADYLVNRMAIVHVVKVNSPDPKDQAFLDHDVTLYAGDMITVMGEVRDPQLGALVRLGVDTDGDDDIPSDFYVPASDLEGAGLQSHAPNFPNEQAAADFEARNEYAVTQIASLHGGKAHKRRGTTQCYHYVKAYLLAKGELSFRPGGRHAYQAVTELGQAGMDRGGCSPSNPEKDCTCVYRGGAHGHVEVYRGNGCWWYGYGCKPAMATLPMGRSGQRTLVTCYH